jgi:hypothetical protein
MLYSVARIPLYVEAGFQFFHSNIYCMSPYATVLKLSSHDDRWSSVPLVWACASDVVDHITFNNIPQMFECKISQAYFAIFATEYSIPTHHFIITFYVFIIYINIQPQEKWINKKLGQTPHLLPHLNTKEAHVVLSRVIVILHTHIYPYIYLSDNGSIWAETCQRYSNFKQWGVYILTGVFSLFQ